MHKRTKCDLITNLSKLAGTYTVVVSTYNPGIIGKFSLTMQSQIKLSLTPIPAEGAVSHLVFDRIVLRIIKWRLCSLFFSFFFCSVHT